MTTFTTCTILALAAVALHAAPSTPPSLEDWIQSQYDFSWDQVKSVIANGSIRASPTSVKPNPDYNYNWVRDAALTMDMVIGLVPYQPNRTSRLPFQQWIENYVKFNKKIQGVSAPGGDKRFEADQMLGEPKWNLDGSVFMGNWTRPQNDGPALRATAMGRYVRYMQHNYANQTAYEAPPAQSPMWVDLDYTEKYWQRPSFEIWEEVKGMHFYTLMAQRRAMLMGAQVAPHVNATEDAARYRGVAKNIEDVIASFWDKKLHQINTTRDYVSGHNYKHSGLDMQVVLAALHSGEEQEQFFDPADDRVLATFSKIVEAFRRIYTINDVAVNDQVIGVALGRYPEDMYNGYDAEHGGNPWMLLTAAGAELCYKVSSTYRRRREIRVTRDNYDFLTHFGGLRHVSVGELLHPGATSTRSHHIRHKSNFEAVLKTLIRSGDAFLSTVRKHVEREGGHMAEQWNRETGKQQGAEDLTWNYVAFMTAVHARKDAKRV